MPSLSALTEFRASFESIANERETITSRGQPFDTLKIPDTEPAPMEEAPQSAPVSDEAVPYDALFGQNDTFGSFEEFLTQIPEDINPVPIDDYQTTEEDSAALSDDITPVDSGSDLNLDDFNLNIDTAPESSPFEDISQTGDADEESQGEDTFQIENIDEEPDTSTTNDEDNFIDTGNETADISNEAADLSSETIDLGGENIFGGFESDTSGDAFSSDNEGFGLDSESMDLGGEAAYTGNEEIASDELVSFGDEISGVSDNDTQGAFSDDSLADTGLGDTEFGDTEFGGFDDTGLGDSGSTFSGETELGGTEGGFDSSNIELDGTFSTEQDAKYNASGAESPVSGSEDFGSDEFSLAGIDDILNKSKIDIQTPDKTKKGPFWKRKQKAPEFVPDDDVEEIQLSQEDMDNILNTLSGFPLNLRIACEEIIAEQVIAPQQLSRLIRQLKYGASVREIAALAEEISGKPIVIPKSFQKSTGAALEAEQASFAYIFVNNFLPVLRLFMIIAALAASVIYLGYKFIYVPVMAESLYKRGYERIEAGEYQQANSLFDRAFAAHQKKSWFYQYAEAYRDKRRYLLAEEKYDELLRNYPKDKKGILDYADLESNYMLNYEKANRILQRYLLDFAPNDYQGLTASGDNYLAWADSDPTRFGDKYDDARFAYARLLQKYGWTSPIVERMLKYFIRTDNLKEVLPLKNWFDGSRKRRLSPPATAELGGYLLDKQLEEVKGVPNPYVESIEGVRAMLLRAVREDLNLPEPHYHLARYYNALGNTYEERLTLENALRAFDMAKEESVRRRTYQIDAYYRYANLLINNHEFFPAEDQLVRGINIYQDLKKRNLVVPSPEFGRLYAVKGDLEYFVKEGNMENARREYMEAEANGYSPPEIQYRIGVTYYQENQWNNALDYLLRASADLPLNRRILYALGNSNYKSGNYFAAQSYYNRLLDILENQRSRLPVLLPNDRPEFLELGERLMMARNNAGVTYEALANITGNNDYRSRAIMLYAESARAWDSITRNPQSMERMRPTDAIGAPSINLGFLNANNALHANNARRPGDSYQPEIFIRIDKDVLEPSRWESLAPIGGLTD
jgi:tetratricopeptide (TPR) repeat protein